MSVQHVRMERRAMPRYLHETHEVGRPELALHGKPRDAELHLRCDSRERGLGAGAAGCAVADDADVMTARGLAARDIEDVPENAADWRTGNVHDLERFKIGHGQNQRSATSMVSPGRSG